MTDIDGIWETLRKEARDTEPLPEERTVSQFMEETGLTRYKAKTFLDKQVDEGKLKKRELKGIFYYSSV